MVALNLLKNRFGLKETAWNFGRTVEDGKANTGAPRQSNKPKKRGSDIGAAGRIHILKF